jgi:hypothetical protein
VRFAVRHGCEGSGSRVVRSVAELAAPAGDEGLELLADAVVDRRLLVALLALAGDAGGPLRRVLAAVALPALEVLGSA